MIAERVAHGFSFGAALAAGALALALALVPAAGRAAAGEAGAEPGAEVPEAAPAKKAYGFLGVEVRGVSADLAGHLGLEDGRGLAVVSVAPESPAAAAGLAARDVIVRVDDQVVYGLEQFRKLIGSKEPGTEVKIERIRKGQAGTVTAKLGSTDRRPWSDTPGAGWEFMRPLGGADWPKRIRELRPPAAVLRFRLPDGEGWKELTPDAENWKQEVEKLMEQLKGQLPEDALEKLREQMERTGRIIEQRAGRAMEEIGQAHKEAAEALKLDPAALSGGEGETAKASASTTVTAEGGGYRVNWRREGDGEATVSLYRKNGEAVFEKISEKELDARLAGLDPAARKLVEMVRRSTAKAEVRIEAGQ